jgi:flagellar protein FliS
VNGYAHNPKLAVYQAVSAHGAVAGADPHGLVLMLLDTVAERITTARACIERGEIARKAKLLHSCVNIVAELRGSLDLAKGGELAQNLSDLYEYMMRQLLLANAKSDARLMTEVAGLIGEIRSAWFAIGAQVRPATSDTTASAMAGATPAVARPSQTR